MKAYLLIASADPASPQSTVRQLALYDEFMIDHASTAEAALCRLSGGQVSVVLAEAPLPDMDETAFCRLARRQGGGVPIVMLGAGGEEHEIRALDAGALDYIARPVPANLLLARLRAHLRHFEPHEAAAIAIERFIFRPGQKLLLDVARGREVRLTTKEAAMLKCLYRAGDKPIGRDRLLAEVWGYEAGADTHTIETHVYRLRCKMGDAPRKARLLVTDGGGYRLAIGSTRSAA